MVIGVDHDVVLGVLIQKPGVYEVADDLGGHAPLAKIGEDPALVRVRGRQDEGRFLPGRRRLGAGDGLIPVGGVPGAAMIGQQVIHRLRETHPAELLEEGDGVSALVRGVTLPSGRVPDADAVHLRRGVVAADPLQRVAQRGQQAQQICVLGEIQLGVREAICRIGAQNITSFWPKAKTAGQGTPLWNTLPGYFSWGRCVCVVKTELSRNPLIFFYISSIEFPVVSSYNI